MRPYRAVASAKAADAETRDPRLAGRPRVIESA